MDLQASAESLLNTLAAQFPLGYMPRLVWRGYRVSAGMAYYKEGVIGLSRVVISDEEKMRSTLIHEYAHLLAVARKGRSAAGHGDSWKQAMRDLGVEPRVRHTYPVQRNGKRQEVAYTCQRCGTVPLRARSLLHPGWLVS